MPNILNLSECECVVSTLRRELGQLERLAQANEKFSCEDIKDLGQCLARLNNIVKGLAEDSEQDPLPHWLQRIENSPVQHDSDEADPAQSI